MNTSLAKTDIRSAVMLAVNAGLARVPTRAVTVTFDDGSTSDRILPNNIEALVAARGDREVVAVNIEPQRAYAQTAYAAPQTLITNRFLVGMDERTEPTAHSLRA